ncbi:MAG: class I SAM-dependent methyltransferase [Blastocatellia bacterium]
MKLTERFHSGYVIDRRVRVLSDHLSELIPDGSSVIDVGCGDGRLAYAIASKLANVKIEGIDVLVRKQTFVPVSRFDGQRIPYDDNFFDMAMLVDVLHHTEDPSALLREAVRVARRSVLIKDHTCDGMLAFPTLKFMDRIGNERYEVTLPFNYYSKQKWLDVIESLGLRIGAWKNALKLYPWPASLIFDRSLHFISRLDLGVTSSRA